jgi:hypothetical protein
MVLIAAGAICLYFSEAVARANSWSANTLDAFGVGLVVGGLVDVSAIPLLDGIFGEVQRRRSFNQIKTWGDRLLSQWADRLGETPTASKPSERQLEDAVWSIRDYLDHAGAEIGGLYRDELQSLRHSLENALDETRHSRRDKDRK